MAAASPRSSKSRLERIHQKFRKAVEDGNFYEASQMSRNLSSRYKNQKKYEDAENLLFESAITLLQHEQNESAFELGKKLIHLYVEINKEINDKSIEKITKIIEASKNLSQSGTDFIQEALGWTTTDYKYGHPKIQESAATKYWQLKDYSEARKHIVYTNDGSKCASFLIEYHVVCGFPGEVDLFVTQAVLQILCLQNTLTATTIFFSYTLNHPGIKRKNRPYKQPLLNFIAFLLLIVEKGNVEQYSILCEQYQPSIQRDPTYLQYLDKIGQLFFGLPPPKKNESGIQGILGGLMESLFQTGGSGEIEEDLMETAEDVD